MVRRRFLVSRGVLTGVFTPAIVLAVPNQPKTPSHTVRVPADLWELAKGRAAERGETVTDVLVRALQRYVKR